MVAARAVRTVYPTVSRPDRAFTCIRSLLY
jgi:hypothetical protein